MSFASSAPVQCIKSGRISARLLCFGPNWTFVGLCQWSSWFGSQHPTFDEGLLARLKGPTAFSDHCTCIAESGDSRTGLPLEFQVQSASSGLFSCFALQWGFAPMSPQQDPQTGRQACFGVALWSNLPVGLPIKRLEVGPAFRRCLSTQGNPAFSWPVEHGLPFVVSINDRDHTGALHAATQLIASMARMPTQSLDTVYIAGLSHAYLLEASLSNTPGIFACHYLYMVHQYTSTPVHDCCRLCLQTVWAHQLKEPFSNPCSRAKVHRALQKRHCTLSSHKCRWKTNSHNSSSSSSSR